jgi:hypothetical protein
VKPGLKMMMMMMIIIHECKKWTVYGRSVGGGVGKGRILRGECNYTAYI